MGRAVSHRGLQVTSWCRRPVTVASFRRPERGLARGPRVATLAGMRSLLLAAGLAAAAAWGLVRHLPEGEAQAEPQIVRSQQIESVAIDAHDLPVTSLREVLASRAGDPL